MVGCRVGAKNTLRKNYLALAENLGVVIEPMRTVTRLGVVPGTEGEHAAYRVLHERTGPVTGRDVQVVTARRVVLAAGAWGTQTLLHDMKANGELPRLSDYLGHRTRTNSEALLGAMTQHVPAGDLDLTQGVAITSSFHVDDTTHIENCRYGKGSNAMGLLATIAVPGGTGRPRWVELLRKVGRDPMGFLRLMPIPRHWSERMVIGLVMQSRDNSLQVTGRRGLLGRPGLTSRQGHGQPNPTYIPRGPRGDAGAGDAARRGDRRLHRGRRVVVRGVRRADDRALPRRGHDRVVARARSRRRLPPGVGLPRPLGGRRLGRLGQPRRQPLAHHHGAGRAGDVVVAQPW